MAGGVPSSLECVSGGVPGRAPGRRAMRCRVPRQPRSHSSERMGQKAGAGGDGSGDRLVTEGGGAAGDTWGADLALWGDAGVLVETHKKENLILEER